MAAKKGNGRGKYGKGAGKKVEKVSISSATRD